MQICNCTLPELKSEACQTCFTEREFRRKQSEKRLQELAQRIQDEQCKLGEDHLSKD